jgi:hypothetical protein
LNGCALWGFRRNIRRDITTVALASLKSEKGFLFDFQSFREVLQKWVERPDEGQVIEDGEDKEDDLENERAAGASNTKETDHADFTKVDTCEDLLESAWVDETSGVNVGIIDEEEVVLEGEVEEV